jgi:hypothetical protein
MKTVIVYVEGPSDKAGLEALLKPIITAKANQGIRIIFRETEKGDRKLSLLEKAPLKAVDILQSDPYALVVVLPDLYPRDFGLGRLSSGDGGLPAVF